MLGLLQKDGLTSMEEQGRTVSASRGMDFLRCRQIFDRSNGIEIGTAQTIAGGRFNTIHKGTQTAAALLACF